jgi:hypothetical protein
LSSGFIETGLSNEALNIHRALASLQEELEAIDHYHQRVGVSGDESLKAVLAHNRDDEMEHAAMLLEWLRRARPASDLQLKKFLFTSRVLESAAAVGLKRKAAPRSK